MMLEIAQPSRPEGAYKVDFSSCNVKPDNVQIGDVSVEVPVLIAGGGPTGLFTAYMLSKHGVKSLLIEKYPERLAAPKAHALCPRTLEICRQYGLDTRAIRKLGSPRDDAYWVNFMTNLTGEKIGVLPYERMDPGVLDSTPEMIHNIPQPDFEKFIAQNLENDPNVEIRKGVGFVSCDQRGDKVTTVVEERATKKRWTIVSRHVIGCDGAKSQVRRFLGIETEGEDGYETMMTIHFNANLRPVVGDRVGMLHWIADPACSGFIIAYDLDGNQVLISNFDAKRNPVESWTEELAHATVSAAIGQDIPIQIMSFRPWVLSRKVAKEYRRGNVFLVGDAAHSFPPTGGLGLNSGLADGHNLAYKIAAVHQGWASPQIFDTYESDRRSIAVVAAAQSVKNGKSIFSFLKAIGTAEVESLSEARKRMYEAIHDPSKQELIAEKVEGQREHFDNLEIHIGYVYGDPKPPANASDFTPKFKVGARLPHAWIKITKPNEPSQFLPQPIDTSYVKELSDEQVAAQQFSTLDLVNAGTFALITPCRAAWSHRFEDCKAVLGQRLNSRLRLWGADSDFQFSSNSHRRLYDTQGGFSKGGAILVRPDQHILGCISPEASADDLVTLIANHLGIEY
ncbi:FAD binding domain-containing protein [Colletotrichum orchidophilum]|uniref:FAD binding domain-containing protein n=1 Tax=Colletotrichum orchidophilum TaxID=1209926 RepID=A0A1G4BL40_9PEZI|nr:FAD binding domain-containing protein [Colletotrichum orchidophilum]OHF02124.1 FAD binding domain-containing protein [Colletotrichum orchidophilum]